MEEVVCCSDGVERRGKPLALEHQSVSDALLSSFLQFRKRYHALYGSIYMKHPDRKEISSHQAGVKAQ